MEIKSKLKMSFIALLIFSLLNCSHQKPGQSASAKKPNIILIMADDLGYGDVGFNGQQLIKTPQIDQLAKEGIIFSQHYAGSTVCAPSRSVLLTGLHTGQTRVRGNPSWTLSGNPVDLLPQDITVANELKRAGYYNAIIGKWGLDETFTTGHPLDQGFDYFFGYRTHVEAHHYYPEFLWRDREKIELEGNKTAEKIGAYTHDLFTDDALEFLKKKKDTTFFLYLAYTIPHYELTVPEDSKKPYLGLGWPERIMKPGHYHHDHEGNTTYAGMVSRLDRDMGRLLELLKELEIDDNTLVIFTSDNGPIYDNGFFNSSGFLRGKKRDLYEGGIRVPFAARWPGKITAGSTSDHVSAFWDFLPTVCELAGIEPNTTTNGISYLPALLGQNEKQNEHNYLYWEFNENEGPIQAVRMGNWKGISKHKKPFELYNLANDLNEMNNLTSEHPDIVNRIKEIFKEARTESEEFPLTKRQSRN